jgi:hypothetical protein
MTDAVTGEERKMSLWEDKAGSPASLGFDGSYGCETRSEYWTGPNWPVASDTCKQ